MIQNIEYVKEKVELSLLLNSHPCLLALSGDVPTPWTVCGTIRMKYTQTLFIWPVLGFWTPSGDTGPAPPQGDKWSKSSIPRTSAVVFIFLYSSKETLIVVISIGNFPPNPFHFKFNTVSSSSFAHVSPFPVDSASGTSLSFLYWVFRRRKKKGVGQRGKNGETSWSQL